MAKERRLTHVAADAERVKARFVEPLSKRYQTLQRRQLFEGTMRTYAPYVDDRTNQVPPEQTLIQHHVTTLLKEAFKLETEMLDVMLLRDIGNQSANADIVLDDGTVVASKVPLAFLLYLRGRWKDVKALLSHIPTHNPAVEWEFDPNIDAYRSKDPRETIRTEKQQTGLTLAQATDKFPAQTQLITKDVAIGRYTDTLFSACMPADRKNKLIAYADRVFAAIETAINEANLSVKVDTLTNIGDKLFAKLVEMIDE